MRFFGVTSLSSIVNVTELAAFRGASGVLDQYSLAAWLRCGELQAREIEVGKFDKKEIKKIIPEIKKLILNSDNLGRELQRICAARGIAVVYTPYFKNIKINGSSRFINGKAIIQLNAKGGYSDIFWFTFFHELGHILLHGSKDKFLEYEGDVKDKKEGEADRFAREILIPSSSLKEFLEDKPLNAEKIKNFANLMMVDSGIVLGRLAHEKIVSWKNISHLRKRIVINLNVKN